MLKILKLAILLFSFLIVACNHDSNILQIEDKTDIQALIKISGETSYSGVSSGEYDAYAMTYFSDGYNFVNVISTSIDKTPLSKVDNLTGQYGAKINYPDYPYKVIWSVNGYGAYTFPDTIEVIPKLNLSNFTRYDTISKSIGRIINFTGGNTTESIVISIAYDPDRTKIEIHPDSVKSGIETIVSKSNNNGQLIITSSFLNSLPSNQYYELTLRQTKYSILILNENRKIGKLIEYYLSVPFYLSN